MSSEIERPTPLPTPALEWGSDVVVQTLRDLGIEYISLNPGASYRGIHDSLVNYLGNVDPQMVVCLHEEHAVALAHGYAKVTDRPMAVGIHSNVGLMHASMAIFNAYCDRVPMLLIGGTGPIDAALRRPWIDWLHTTADQASLVRPFIKWDDQPGSAVASVSSLARAYVTTRSRPSAPTYVCFDLPVQEARLPDNFVLPDVSGVPLPIPAQPDVATTEQLLDMFRQAERPLILAGRVSRSTSAWADRVALAEALQAPVLTHLKLGAAFPTNHELHPLGPVSYRSRDALKVIAAADLVVSLDWLDLGGILRAAGVADDPSKKVISISVDHELHGGWSKDHFEFPLNAMRIPTDPDAAVSGLLQQFRAAGRSSSPRPGWLEFIANTAETPERTATADALGVDDVLSALQSETAGREVTYIRLPTAWPMGSMVLSHPLDYLGTDGGEGIGSGPGMAVGAALALRGTDRLPVAVIGDGDFLMGMNALWSAAHYSIPLLLIVVNNDSYLNDEIHQGNVAVHRGRPAQNAWVGQRTSHPSVDISTIATAQGLLGFGPVTEQDELSQVLAEAIKAVEGGAAAVVEVRIGVDLKRTGRPAGPSARSLAHDGTDRR